MRCRELALAWQNNLDAENQPMKAISSGLDIRLPAVAYNGHEAPAVTIQGIIDSSLSDPTYNSDNNPYVTVQWLGSLALVGSGYLLYPAVTQFINKAPVATGSISAMIRGVKLTPDVNSFVGSEYILNYSMDLVLVSGPV